MPPKVNVAPRCYKWTGLDWMGWISGWGEVSSTLWFCKVYSVNMTGLLAFMETWKHKTYIYVFNHTKVVSVIQFCLQS